MSDSPEPPVSQRWNLTEHVCRQCLGRILERNKTFMCSSCEAVAALRPHALCGCGMKAPNARAPLPNAVRAAYRCGVNPARGPASPARYCILFGGEPANPLDHG